VSVGLKEEEDELDEEDVDVIEAFQVRGIQSGRLSSGEWMGCTEHARHGTSLLRIENEIRWAPVFFSSGDAHEEEVATAHYNALSLDPKVSELPWNIHGIAWWTETGAGRSRVP
jgi:hypothetical protein